MCLNVLVNCYLCSWLLLMTTQHTQCVTLIISVSALGNTSCPVGYYTTSASADQVPSGCTPCTSCSPGYGVTAQCSQLNNTQCEECAEGTFSFLLQNTSQRICKPCKVCSPSRTEVTPCTMYRDSICGQCEREFFLYVSSSGEHSCLPCSPCPVDIVATHWYECELAGLPVNQQCAPGYENSTEATVSEHTTDRLSSISVATYWAIDQEDFISQPTIDILTVISPLPAAVGISITTVMVVLTLIAIVVFSVGSWYILRDKCPAAVIRGTRKTCQCCSVVCIYSQRKWLCWKCRKVVAADISTDGELEELDVVSATVEQCDDSSLSSSFDPS